MPARLRIALVTEVMETGVGQLIELLAQGFAGGGHDVHLLHSVRRADTAVVERLSAIPNIHCVAVDMRREIHPSDGRALRTIRTYLRRHGPFDIVHGHSSKGGALARLASAGLPGIVLYTPHAFYTLSPGLGRARYLLYANAERALAKLCSAVICSSDREREHAVALGIEPARLRVIANAINPLLLAPAARERFDFPSGAIIAGFVGRFAEQKAPDLLIEAMARAVRQCPDLHLIMIGAGPLEGALRERAATLGMGERVRWIGRLPSAGYLRSLDMLVMPSRYEGFSLMPLEAMQAGLPIICTNVGGVAEAVVDGATGLVVPIDDRAALGDAILALAGNPARRQALGQAARERVALFTPDRMVGATEQLYRDLIAHSHPSATEAAVKPLAAAQGSAP